MKELDEYIAAKQALQAAHERLASAFGIDWEDVDRVIDSRHESWGTVEVIGYRGKLRRVEFAPDEQTLLEGDKVSRLPAGTLGVRKYPKGYSGGGRLTTEVQADSQIVRSAEWVGLRMESSDDDRNVVLIIVRADREVPLAGRDLNP